MRLIIERSNTHSNEMNNYSKSLCFLIVNSDSENKVKDEIITYNDTKLQNNWSDGVQSAKSIPFIRAPQRLEALRFLIISIDEPIIKKHCTLMNIRRLLVRESKVIE